MSDPGVLVQLEMKQHISMATSVSLCHIWHLRRLDLSLWQVSQLILTTAIVCPLLCQLLPFFPQQCPTCSKCCSMTCEWCPHDHGTYTIGCLAKIVKHANITLSSCMTCLFVFTRCSSVYLSDLVIATSDIPSRYWLTSANTKRYEQLTTRLEFAEHHFSHAGAIVWNDWALSSNVQGLTDTNAFKLLYVKTCDVLSICWLLNLCTCWSLVSCGHWTDSIVLLHLVSTTSTECGHEHSLAILCQWMLNTAKPLQSPVDSGRFWLCDYGPGICMW